jgi:asparagine synthase (glutamine-hydrolysing)
VRARTRSTKPIGILLSGGMDSGSIASTLGWLREHGHDTPPVHTYSWAFDELTTADERHVSDAIVERYGLIATPIPADEVWPLKDYPAHGPDRDDPFIRVYQPLMARTLDAARADGVGTALVGDHGDETVGDWVFDHVGMLAAGRLIDAWREVRAHARWSGRPVRSIARRHVLAPLLQALSRRRTPPRPHVAMPRFIHPDWAARVGLGDALSRPALPPAGLQGARAERYGRLFATGGLLDPTSLERHCSRYGLDLRNPWSDRRLASFVLAVPQWVIQRPSAPKRIARQAMRGIMPEGALRSAGKTEPAALFERGFSDRARATVSSLATDSQLVARGFVDDAKLRALYDALAEGRHGGHDPWWPITMEMWLRRYWS